MSAEEQARTRPSPESRRPPPWRDERVLRIVAQVVFALAVFALLRFLGTNLLANMRAQGMRTDWGFLERPAGFTLGAGTEFSSRDSILDALFAGVQNTIVVSAWGIVLATLVGVIVGVSRLSTNWLVRKSAAVYVEALRNVPPIVFLLFLYLAVLVQLPRISDAVAPLGIFVLSNRGLHVPWFDIGVGVSRMWVVVAVGVLAAIALGWWRTQRFNRTGQPHHRIAYGLAAVIVAVVVGWFVADRPVLPSVPVLDGRLVEGGRELGVEYGALLFGLVLYMSAFVAEIVRGSILSVSKGQTEAANALGLSGFQRLRFVILPQALRVAIPPAGNEFINLAKNSALGIAIAFPELLRVTRIAIGQGNPAPQLVGLLMLFFLVISLVLSLLANLANRRLQLRGGA